MVARQREADAVVLQSYRSLIQKRDLASHAQSLFRLRDQFWRQSHPPENGSHWHASALEARDY
jgi:hypothetical protein